MSRKNLCWLTAAVWTTAAALGPFASTASAAEPAARSSAASSAEIQKHQRLLDRYCITCHNEKRNTANVNLELVDLAAVGEHAAILEKVLHKVRIHDMPPPDNRQPNRRARRNLLAWLEQSLDEAAAADPNPGRPAVHRLNRAEYANAVRDLLGLEIDTKTLLPAEGADFGFDNIADSLNMSPLLLERYILAASKVSRLAIGDPQVRTSSKIYKLPKLLIQNERMSEDLPFGSRGGTSVRHHFPVDGEYVIKVNVESPRSDQPKDLFQRSPAPEQLDVRVDGERVGQGTIGDPNIKQWSYGKNGSEGGGDKKDPEKEHWFGARTFEFRFPAKAGTHTIAISFLKRTLAYEGVRPRFYPAFYDYLGILKNVEPGVMDFEVIGPFNSPGLGDLESRRKIFTRYPENAEQEAECATEILHRLAHQAYRRPLTDADMETLMSFYEAGYEDGGFESGIQFALERILVSPSFLFRVELPPGDHQPGTPYQLTDLQLASRLSFFLWSSIPDEELLEVAQRGELRNPEILEQQVRRMIADKRSESLTANFATQWLYLRNVDAAKPDVNTFPEFDGNLQRALRRETELFFDSQLREDRPIADLLTADYTFLNQRLAEHYEIPDIYGSHFRRVKLDDPNRAGLLGHGSILTVTSYATRTSPVKRGKWLLENILGSPPPPPPADVPDLPETSPTGEAATMRERMELHLQDPTCASCHVKMDPLGFALESFDAIGKFRTSDGGLPVDSLGELPDGTKMDGPAGLRKVLDSRRGEFVSTTTRKLLTYALGRGIEYYDLPAVREILRQAEADDYSWSSVILGIVKSTPFQMRSSS